MLCVFVRSRVTVEFALSGLSMRFGRSIYVFRFRFLVNGVFGVWRGVVIGWDVVGDLVSVLVILAFG